MTVEEKDLFTRYNYLNEELKDINNSIEQIKVSRFSWWLTIRSKVNCYRMLWRRVCWRKMKKEISCKRRRNWL